MLVTGHQAPRKSQQNAVCSRSRQCKKPGESVAFSNEVWVLSAAPDLPICSGDMTERSGTPAGPPTTGNLCVFAMAGTSDESCMWSESELVPLPPGRGRHHGQA